MNIIQRNHVEYRLHPASISRTVQKGPHAGKLLEIGVSERENLEGTPWGKPGEGSLGYYVCLNGESVNKLDAVLLIEVGSKEDLAHGNIPAGFTAYLKPLGCDDRFLILPDEHEALKRAMTDVQATPFGQHLAQLRAAQQAKEAAAEQARVDSHNKVNREGRKCLIWPSEMGWEYVWYLGKALEIPEAERGQGTQWQGQPPKYATLMLGGLPELRNTWLDPEMDAIVGDIKSDSNIIPLTDEQWDAVQALSARRVQARKDAEVAQAAADQAKEAAAFARAKATGEPQLLDSWMGEDDSIPDNSYSHFALLAMPDGSTKTKKTPTY